MLYTKMKYINTPFVNFSCDWVTFANQKSVHICEFIVVKLFMKADEFCIVMRPKEVLHIEHFIDTL